MAKNDDEIIFNIAPKIPPNGIIIKRVTQIFVMINFITYSTIILKIITIMLGTKYIKMKIRMAMNIIKAFPCVNVHVALPASRTPISLSKNNGV